jgi:hypothetical protein
VYSFGGCRRVTMTENEIDKCNHTPAPQTRVLSYYHAVYCYEVCSSCHPLLLLMDREEIAVSCRECQVPLSFYKGQKTKIMKTQSTLICYDFFR